MVYIACVMNHATSWRSWVISHTYTGIALGGVTGVSRVGEITLHQVEMWLCEYQKYWKMRIGEGKQRSTFEPRTRKLVGQ